MYKKIREVGEKLIKTINTYSYHSYFVGFDLNLNFFFNGPDFLGVKSNSRINSKNLLSKKEIEKLISISPKYGDKVYRTSNECIINFIKDYSNKLQKIKIGGNSVGVGETLNDLNRNVVLHIPPQIISEKTLSFLSTPLLFGLNTDLVSLNTYTSLEKLLKNWNGVMSIIFDYKKHRNIINSLWVVPFRVNEDALHTISNLPHIAASFLSRVPTEDIPIVKKYLPHMKNRKMELCAAEFYHNINNDLIYNSFFSTFYSTLHDFLKFYKCENHRVTLKEIVKMLNKFLKEYLPKNEKIRFIIHSKDVEICITNVKSEKEKIVESMIAGSIIACSCAYSDRTYIKNLEKLLFEDLGYKIKISEKGKKISKNLTALNRMWKDKKYYLVSVPTILCEPITTVGLGDAFEATEMFYRVENF